jgi:glycosyltransferase involved in cell wall biosynthesis
MIKIVDSYDWTLKKYGDTAFFRKSISVLPELLYESNTNLTTKFSILVPTYQRAEYVLETLCSIVNQTFTKNFEILICNDDPSDDCTLLLSFLKTYHKNNQKVRLYRNKTNLQQFGTTNLLIYLASSEWVTIVHDDDLLDPKFLEVTTMHTKGSANVIIPHIVAFGNSHTFDRGNNFFTKLKKMWLFLFRWTYPKTYFRPAGIYPNFSTPSPVNKLYKRNALIECGGFDDNPIGDFYLNVIKFYPYYNQLFLSDNLYFSRQGNGLSNSMIDFNLIFHTQALSKLLSENIDIIKPADTIIIEQEINKLNKFLNARFDERILKHYQVPVMPARYCNNLFAPIRYYFYWIKTLVTKATFLFFDTPSQKHKLYLESVHSSVELFRSSQKR